MRQRLPRICFVAPNAFPVIAGDDRAAFIGGAELQQTIVARGLAERGYPVSMICWDFGQAEECEIGGVRIIRACRPDEGLPIVRFFWPRLTTIWRCLEVANADIYYQRTAGMLTGVVAKYCERRGRRSIFAAAGNPDFERPTPRIRHSRDRWIYEYGVRHVDCLVVQNSEQARLCRENFGRDAIYIPSCYQSPRRSAAKKLPIVLWVSTLRSVKRPELFLDLAEALPGVQFRMVGGPDNGEPSVYASITRRASKIPNLEFVGFVPYSRIDEHFDSASVFVNTSESEGFPNTFLQAWSRGIPTISFVDCGARLEGEPVGRQVNSLTGMRNLVHAWLDNEDERAASGERCRRYCQEHHSPTHVLDLYAEVFSALFPGKI